MAHQRIGYAKRGEESLRFMHVFVLVLSALFYAKAVTASASPELTKPTRDVIDLCTWSSADRTSIAQDFAERGWTKFRAPFPKAIPLLLADGALFHALVDERRNSFGLDTETGVIPDMSEYLETISDVSQSGVYDAFLWDGESQAFLMIYGNADNLKLGEDLGCRYFSTSQEDAARVSEAMRQYPGKHYEVAMGPARTVNTDTLGAKPHQYPSGALGFLVRLGILVEPPILEPQIDAGPAIIDAFWFEQSEFEERFSRKPNAAFALEIVRRNEAVKP